MKLTAEYLESKGWKKSERFGDIFTVSFDGTEFGLCKIENYWKLFGIARPNTTAVSIASNIRTQSRFDRLWSAITEQD